VSPALPGTPGDLNLRWVCHVCGEERPDARISVFKRDVSAFHNLPPGTFMENIRYCNDRSECREGARTKSHDPVITQILRGASG
jgi:hypothetical protein